MAIEDTTTHVRADIDPVFESLLESVADRAHKAAWDVIDQITQDRETVSFETLRELSIPVADVEDNIELLSHQIHVTRSMGGPVPCLRIGEGAVPLAFPFIGLPSLRRGARSHLYRYYPPYWLDILHDFGEPVEFEPVEGAIETVKKALGGFLSVRLAAKKLVDLLGGLSGSIGGGGPGSAPPTMLSIKVHSPNVFGARVHYAPAYFINYSVLSSPTSPVIGYVLPGTYVFAVSEASGNWRSDNGKYNIPPHFDFHIQV